MKRINKALQLMLLFGVIVAGCEGERKISTTEGTATIECDESVYPPLKLIAEDFLRSYKNATIDIRPVEAREAVANFLLDSVRVIVTARELNKEEKDVVSTIKLQFDNYHVALDAVAVIVHKSNPLQQFRMSELDSIFSGKRTRWPGKKGNVIDVAVGGKHSSTNDVFQNTVMGGAPFALTVFNFSSSNRVVEYVSTNPNAIGIVGLSWLKGHEADVTICSLGTPGARPDSTQPFGKFYPPVQAHVYRKYYPVTRPVYMYNRQIVRDVGYGFISYVTSPRGQQIFLDNGLVPVTMPIRLVELTQQQVP